MKFKKVGVVRKLSSQFFSSEFGVASRQIVSTTPAVKEISAILCGFDWKVGDGESSWQGVRKSSPEEMLQKRDCVMSMEPVWVTHSRRKKIYLGLCHSTTAGHQFDLVVNL